ncbi:MAG TPA: hypothetical protein VFF73_14715 [Planctomycetota bacterium]|nr:hypothetical protein [Planctomycetota bacterium]
MKPTRLRRIDRRIVLPGAVIAVATYALGLLLFTPADATPRHATARAVVPLPARPASAPVVLAPRVPAPAPSPRPTTLPAPAPAERPRVSPLPGLAVEMSWDEEIARASDLMDRLKILDRIINTADPADWVALAERLLDKPPAAPSPEEARALRIALVTRLGLLKSVPRAAQRLTTELAATFPQPERLAAIEALAKDGAVPPQARPTLERLASVERDPVVRERARLATGRGG